MNSYEAIADMLDSLSDTRPTEEIYAAMMTGTARLAALLSDQDLLVVEPGEDTPKEVADLNLALVAFSHLIAEGRPS